jgi:uncharacterized membrane protein YeaQ/YmgE (transglycosylase-associated protein family)
MQLDNKNSKIRLYSEPQIIGNFQIIKRTTFKEEGAINMATIATLVLGLSLDPGGIIAWLVVGLIAGALAGMVMKGGGYGIIGDIVIGIIGAFLGGFLASLLGIGGSGGLITTIIVAFIGACILIAILRAVSGGRRRAL